MNDAILDTLFKRKDRMAAIVLSAWETNDPDFRKVVLDQVNDYYDLVVNLFAVVDDNSVVLNDAYVRKIDEIHSRLTEG